MTLLDNAKHNENCSKYLLESGQYCAWAIVIAYYSAIKYIEDALFPLEINGEVYEKFNAYFIEVCMPNANKGMREPKKHIELLELYKKEIGDGWESFCWLYDSGMNIRYNSKEINEFNKNKYAEKTRVSLDTIKRFTSAKKELRIQKEKGNQKQASENSVEKKVTQE